MSYSDDFKDKALALLDGGLSYQKVATTLGISKSTLQCWAMPAYAEESRERNRARYAKKVSKYACPACGRLSAFAVNNGDTCPPTTTRTSPSPLNGCAIS